MERAPINLLGWGAAPKLTTDLLILWFGVRQNPHASTPEAWPQLIVQNESGLLSLINIGP